MSQEFTVIKIPADELSLSNRLVFNPADIIKLGFIRDKEGEKKAVVEVQDHLFGICSHLRVPQNKVGFSSIQRQWLNVSIESTVHVKAVNLNVYLASVSVTVDFLQKKKITKESYNTDLLQSQFQEQFDSMPFEVDQEVVFKYQNLPLIKIKIQSLSDMKTGVAVERGLITQNTSITFDRMEESLITLSGKAKGKSAMPSLINPDWDFSQMGIGGLDNEFAAIFRRAFASRVYPPDLIEELGMQHVKGILLYGPPGTGKTLMARQIGKMLNAREPQIVNGPEILNKYVGESEANVRKLFEAAEEDQKKFGINSGLHIIILDEIDAICKQRGTVSGSTGVADTVVNQLLSKVSDLNLTSNFTFILFFLITAFLNIEIHLSYNFFSLKANLNLFTVL